MEEEQTRRGGGCGSILAVLVIMAMVISGAVWLSPTLDLGNVRNTIQPTDPLDGVAGSGGDGYTFLSVTPRGAPVTWACEQQIDIVVNPEGAPEGYAELVAGAVAEVNEASGFTFVVTGETDERDFTQRRQGPVLLGWADEEEVPALAGPTAGLGGSTYVSGPGGDARAVGGMVVVDRDLPGGWFREVDQHPILVHELLHVLGLGHTDDPAELMAPEHQGQEGLGEGDRAGLAALDAAACG